MLGFESIQPKEYKINLMQQYNNSHSIIQFNSNSINKHPNSDSNSISD